MIIGVSGSHPDNAKKNVNLGMKVFSDSNEFSDTVAFVPVKGNGNFVIKNKAGMGIAI